MNCFSVQRLSGAQMRRYACFPTTRGRPWVKWDQRWEPVKTQLRQNTIASIQVKPSVPPELKEFPISQSASRSRDPLVGLTGSKIFHQMMVQHGVTHIFGLPGGAIMPCFDAIYKAREYEFILVKHEQNAGHMAEGYARVTGKPGIVLVTSGPGATNVTTALQDAMSDGTPIIVFCGQVSTKARGKDAFQEANMVQIAKTCTKWSVAVDSVEHLPSSIDRAFEVATSGRPGPVLIDLPKDVTENILEEPVTPVPDLFPEESLPTILAEQVSKKDLRDRLERVAELVKTAKKPVIYAGQGVFGHPDGSKLLKELSDKAQLPVTTSLQGLGAFDETDYKALHMLGMHGAAYANLAMQEADLIIALGARFDDRVTGEVSKFATKARAAGTQGKGGIVHFEILRANINKVITATEVIEGDLTTNLGELLPLITPVKDRKLWFDQIDHWKREYPLYDQEHAKLESDGFVSPQVLIRTLSEMTDNKKNKTIITTGVGQHQMWAAQHFRWRFPRTWVGSGGMGTMGFGLPAAIGAKLARPDALVVDIDGDGSFNMSLTELSTAVQYNVGVKVIVLNNQEHGMITQWQHLLYENRFSGAQLTNPDFCALSNAMGLPARRCSQTSNIHKDLQWLLEDCDKGPAMLEVMIRQKRFVSPMVTGSKGLDEMLFMKGKQYQDVPRSETAKGW